MQSWQPSPFSSLQSMQSSFTYRSVCCHTGVAVFLSLVESVVYTPTFVELSTKDVDTNKKKLKEAEVKYPCGE